ncbi:hypothetical protein [Reichenbachiella versicolor]|uniref:hypothetical protein n=1 Tax=Reichenbachiella versicolor TaxID=1821036 RepID=UPI000D6E70D1|nr:hypothetical protein [Reichenbachiella versicolor]
MKTTLLLLVLLMVGVTIQAQTKFEQTVGMDEVPELVMDSLQHHLTGYRIDSVVTSIAKLDSPFGIKYRFQLDGVETEEARMVQIGIFESGIKFMNGYRYENTGELPLEVFMIIQEQCQSNKVNKMARFDFVKTSTYFAECGGYRYQFDENFKLTKKMGINKDGAEVIHH